MHNLIHLEDAGFSWRMSPADSLLLFLGLVENFLYCLPLCIITQPLEIDHLASIIEKQENVFWCNPPFIHYIMKVNQIEL